MLLTFTSISISLKNIDRTGDMNGWTMTDDRINRGGRRGLRSSDLKGEQKERAAYLPLILCLACLGPVAVRAVPMLMFPHT